MPIKGFKKTYCVRGHLRSEENVDVRRACKLCLKEAYREEVPKKKKRRHTRLLEIKLEVLSHYGKNSVLQCCWPNCVETDLDVLTLDHIANDGYKDRKNNAGSSKLYPRLIREQFPTGFQTLCANHQLKKEIMRRRSLLEVSTHAEK